MTGYIIPASEFARRRAERDQRRQQQRTYAGSILCGLLDDETDEPYAPASPAREKETRR